MHGQQNIKASGTLRACPGL